MYYRNMFFSLRNQAGADGDGAGSGAGGQQGLTQADLDAAVEKAVGGLKAKNSELLGKLKTQGDQLKQFEGIDPDAVRLMLKQFSDNEEAELIKAGKFDEAFNKRTEKLNGEHQKQMQRKESELKQALARGEKLSRLAVNGALAAAAGEAGALPESMKAVQALAKGLFVTDDNGEVVALDADGDIVYGKDGKTPLSVGEWLESLKEEMPNLFAKPTGGGAKGLPTGTGAKGTLKRSEMSPEQKLEFIEQHGQQAFLKLPR